MALSSAARYSMCRRVTRLPVNTKVDSILAARVMDMASESLL